MGHDVSAMKCVGFITLVLRGTEWAATGDVTIPMPDDFPTAGRVSTRGGGWSGSGWLVWVVVGGIILLTVGIILRRLRRTSNRTGMT
jgi:hypothetical protein